ncbi:MAG: MoxR family ATPase [Bdellovibrionales bacterium]|nr:MoxR family ATPase [Bdellovibrionales bacterium]
MSWLKRAGQKAGLTLSEMAQVVDRAETIILGKQQQLKLAMTAILAHGHVLLEDVPGVGKTTLVKTLAQLLGLKTKRIQFTNDLLPADILGTTVFDNIKNEFVFHPGPIFAQIIIADELNRATPKTQSALLQAMEERRVTVDGRTYSLPDPFFVVATQNPSHQMGTYPLPESQLDRFMFRIEMGYPNRKAEYDLLTRNYSESSLEISPMVDEDKLKKWQNQVEKVFVSPAVVNYLQNLIDCTRSGVYQVLGLSPRAGLAWLKAARSWALLNDRHAVLPEDIQSVGVALMSHRIAQAKHNLQTGDQLAREILAKVSVD